MSLLGKVEPFEYGTDTWSDYWDTIEQYFLANDIEDNKKRTATFLTLIGKDTYSILNSLTAPDKPSTKKAEELNDILREHFEPKPIVISERYKFYNRAQKDGESLAQFIAELRKLTIHCEFKGFLEEALRDRFVCGLTDSGIRKRLLTEKKLDLKSAISLAKNMENAKTQNRNMEIKEITQNYAIKQSTRKRRCYRCNSENHLANSCGHKETVCNQCNTKGHLARVCRRSRQTNRINASSSEKDYERNNDVVKTRESSGSKDNESDNEGNFLIEKVRIT